MTTTSGSSASPAPDGSPQPFPSPSASPSSDPLTAGVVAGTVGAGGGSGQGGPGPGGSGGSTDGSRAGGPGSGSGGPASGLTGPPSLLSVLARTLPTMVVTTGGVTMLMAFLMFGKKRRDELPTAPDDVLAAAAATGSGMVPRSGLVDSVVMPNANEARSAVQAAAAVAAAVDDIDAHLPRWRRPSLMEARKADPLRNVSTDVRLSFERDVDAALGDMERRFIRYRLVSLLDAPDEVRGLEIGVLDEGDEVVLLEKRGTYWRVLCPDGREGWLHKMTLGDVVIDASTEPRGSWTSGDGGPGAGGFEDVLRAYTERRERSERRASRSAGSRHRNPQPRDRSSAR